MPELIVAVLIAVAVVIAVAWRSVAVTPQEQRHVVERLGRYRRVLEPGLHLVVPFLDVVAHRLDMRPQQLRTPSVAMPMADGDTVQVRAEVGFRITDPVKATYEVADLGDAVSTLALTSLRTIVGGLGPDELARGPRGVEERLLLVLDEAAVWGVAFTHTRVGIDDDHGPAFTM